PNTKYRISYDLKIENQAQCYLFCYEFNAAGSASGGLVSSTGRWSTNGKWETVSYDFTTASTTRTVRLDLLHNGVAGTSYWDHLCLVKDGVTENTPKLTDNADGTLTLQAGKLYSKTALSEANVSYILRWPADISAQESTVSVWDAANTKTLKTAGAAAGKVCVPSAEKQYFTIVFEAPDRMLIGPLSMTVNYGDFDESGTTDATDVIAQKTALLAQNCTDFNDLTGDTQIDVRDLVRIKKYAAQ
ncbi:MAG: hypothetical protein MJ132_04790, partial [Clostridia bacterium]|nr:hypothetical protein [Clostridia bacterium]